MSDFSAMLAILGALVLLAGAAGGTYAHFKSSEDKEEMARVRAHRDDLLSRLNFIEPRVKLLEQQNEVLMSLHNPAQQITNLAEQEQRNHVETVRLLQSTHDILEQIDGHLTNGSADA